MKIGLFTDCHAGTFPAEAGKFYSHSFAKFQDYAAYFHRENVDFVVGLGDVCEWNGNAEQVQGAFRRMVFSRVMARYPFVFVLGNHDVAGRTKKEFYSFVEDPMSGMTMSINPTARPRPALPKIDVKPENSPYFSFVKDGWKYIVLDTNYREDGSSIENELVRGITYICPEELEWLKNELADGMKTIIFTHANLDSRMVDGKLHPCVLGNAEEVRKVLEGGNVKLVMQGHAHEGGFTECNGIPYVTMRATVLGEYPESLSVAVLDVADDKLTLEGFGKMPSYEFKL